jgi:hypothetical protein
MAALHDPDQDMISPHDNPEGFFAVLAAIGAAIGIGKALGQSEPLPLHVMVGKAITSAGIAAAAGATSLLFPTADPLVLYGVGAGLASVGIGAIEMIVHKKFGSPSDKEGS